MERLLERLLFASRWLLAPIYLGLSLMLIALVVKFFQHIWHVYEHLWHVEEADLILGALGLVDLALVASLVIMVMFAGYENFVSRIDIDQDAEKLGWFGKVDASTLKLKVAVSIVAISSIHLLKAFMDLPHLSAEKLTWYVIMHLTFVVSALLMGVLDRISFSSHREH